MTPTASVLVCRGCCCGRDDPEPAAQRLATLRSGVDDLPGGRVTVVNCLGPCSDRDVVAVRHRDTERRGGRLGTTWFRRVDADAAGRIAGWVREGAVAPVPAALVPHLFDPGTTGSPSVTPDHEITVVDGTPIDVVAALSARRVPDAEVRSLVRTLIGYVGVSWSVGVEGASADVLLVGADRRVAEDADRLGAADHTGDIELDLSVAPGLWVLVDDGGAPVSVVVATRTEPPGARGLAELADPRGRAGHVLFDLGVPGTRFGVSVEEPVLAARLRAHRGRAAAAVLAEVGTQLIAVSPERVVATPVATTRVRTAVPALGGRFPEGSHTHLLAERFTRDRPSIEQLSLPGGWWVGAVASLAGALPRTAAAARDTGTGSAPRLGGGSRDQPRSGRRSR
ncbi:(2Fe-2S) ferredoxin domain-containing protein [Blastococcus sp. CCUG 61487]|uniref:(2Fe-2S) ferredoxin domain-containing protein n=1 Tax=Blastococcus sp. CCUG 61487 TaxID=1840703 RepID=UPI0010C0AF0A|nr:(2Fe-2S) ferredoxin domain-containing protein [Blastococcus sp. CCUG 61487]TKJ18277.1 hypothetical protein A6V29_11780 [Blastococcus sp. CCUG 61487]